MDGVPIDSHHTATRTHTIESMPADTDYLDLPYREVTNEANLEEYTRETREGQIIKPVRSDATGETEDFKLVTFTEGDPENPKNWSKAYKWYITMVVAFTCFVVALCSSVVTADFPGVEKTFHVSQEVAFLTITVFVVGFGVGKLIHVYLFFFFFFRLSLTTVCAQDQWHLLPCRKCWDVASSTHQLLLSLLSLSFRAQ